MNKQILTMSIAFVLAGCETEGKGDSSTTSNKSNVFTSQCGDQLSTQEPSLSFVVKGDVAELRGVICQGSPKAFEQMMTKHSNIKQLKFISIDGSVDDEANLQLAYKVRAKQLDSYIASDGQIASGGTDLFLAGAKRTIESGATIGVHSWAAGEQVATDFPVGHQHHQPYIDYYQKMGLPYPEGFYYFTIKAAPAESIHNMSEQEIKKYGLGDIVSASGDTALANGIDNKLFEQFNASLNALKFQSIWGSYGDYLAKAPAYMLRLDEKSSTPVTAYLINPHKVPEDAQKLGVNESGALDIYKYEPNMHTFHDAINKGNGAYERQYAFNGGKYYLQVYKPSDTYLNKEHQRNTIALAVHEMFHDYQLAYFKDPANYFNELNGYPVNVEQITYKLVVLDLFKSLPKVMTQDEAKSMLKQYIALTQEQIRIDSSNKQYAKNMGLGQELFEGSAWYVEVMALRNALPNFSELKFVEPYAFTTKYQNRESVESQFGWGYFYPSGAAAIYALKAAGYDINQLEKGITPFEAAKQIVGQFNVAATLDEIKHSDGFKALKQSAITINTIK
ncbi:hypothetical protein [Vibrio hyugaensis]|uniref:hypothetical protein n=1 Tax=Vibrio hyugaensis TaxID=1534743 RepID=UPI000CE39741|nr:hypothetical protein [Vibrio hyugaensis]